MKIEYLHKRCTRCNAKEVIPPLKKDLCKPRILVLCHNCGKCSRYNVVNHVDGSQGYYLSKWGRDKVDDNFRKKPATVSWSRHQETLTRAKGETKQSLLNWAYCVKVLMLDK